MNIVEIKPDTFDELVLSEPNSTFFQSSNWANFYTNLGYNPLYIGYEDEHHTYQALAMILVEQGASLFNKKAAICPFGFLINYFDTALLNDFIKKLKKFLNKKNINKLTINPNVRYSSGKINNDLLIKNLEKSDFKKTKDNSYYNTEIILINEAEKVEDITIRIRNVDSNDGLFVSNTNYNNLNKAMENKAHFIVAELDCEKTLNKLNKSVENLSKYIEMHQDDYQYDKKVQTRKIKLEEKQKILFLVNKMKNEGNYLLAVTCLIEYNNTITQLFQEFKDAAEVFNTAEILQEQVLKTITSLGYDCYDSFTENTDSVKIDLIGEFTYQVK